MAKKKNQYSWLQPLTFRAARRSARRSANMEYGGQIRQVQAERRASDARLRDLGDWFGEYQRSLASARDASAGAYSDTERRIAERAQGAVGADQMQNQNMMREAMADAQTRGVAFDPSAFQQATQASGARLQADNRMADLTALTGANQSAFMNDKSTIGQGELISQRLREQARGRTFDNDMRNLQADRGRAMRDAMDRQRQQERDYRMALSGQAIERASLGEKANYADAMRDVARMGQNKTVNVNNSYSGLGGGSGASNPDVREGIALIRNTSKKKKKSWSDKEFIDALITSGKGIDANEARRAVRRWRRSQKRR